MDKYQWTSRGMSITTVENGQMRYVREVDYAALEDRIMALSNSIFQYGMENSRLQLTRDALEIRIESLEAQVVTLTARVKELEIGWTHPENLT